MVKYLVIGDPVAHSRSPGMQNAAFEALGLGRPYGIRHVVPSELADFFAFARENLLGVNLTVPHKTAAAELADSLSIRAARCGSVNTLVIRDGHILGDSTDGLGLEGALMWEFGLPLYGQRFILFGAGGAARATAVHFGCEGAAELIFVNRTISRAEELACDVKKFAPSTVCTVIAPDDRAAIAAALERSAALIQATSLGLKADDPPPFDPDLLKAGMKIRIFDTIYHPTALQLRAKELGLRSAGGKEMLIRQGAASFELWTGEKAPLEAMRKGFEIPPGEVKYE